MKYEWLSDYCLSKKGAEKEYKPEWEVYRYMIRGKMFVMQGNDNTGKEIITVKLDPMHGEMVREKYKDIMPGYYMNKVHWNSIDLNGDVPDDIVKEMLDESYTLIVNGLTKKEREMI